MEVMVVVYEVGVHISFERLHVESNNIIGWLSSLRDDEFEGEGDLCYIA